MASVFNRITFSVSDGVRLTRIDLTADGPFTIEAGTDPNVNMFRCSYLEFDKLGQRLDRPGVLEFWYENQSSASGKPADAKFARMRIIDVEGLAQGSPATAPGTIRRLEYRLHIADFREAFAPGRGGTVRLGIVNPH